MFYCCHRINTVNKLKNIPICYGIEIDKCEWHDYKKNKDITFNLIS
jgi:hypothetical protein